MSLLSLSLILPLPSPELCPASACSIVVFVLFMLAVFFVFFLVMPFMLSIVMVPFPDDDPFPFHHGDVRRGREGWCPHLYPDVRGAYIDADADESRGNLCHGGDRHYAAQCCCCIFLYDAHYVCFSLPGGPCDPGLQPTAEAITGWPRCRSLSPGRLILLVTNRPGNRGRK